MSGTYSGKLDHFATSQLLRAAFLLQAHVFTRSCEDFIVLALGNHGKALPAEQPRSLPSAGSAVPQSPPRAQRCNGVADSDTQHLLEGLADLRLSFSELRVVMWLLRELQRIATPLPTRATGKLGLLKEEEALE